MLLFLNWSDFLFFFFGNQVKYLQMQSATAKNSHMQLRFLELKKLRVLTTGTLLGL